MHLTRILFYSCSSVALENDNPHEPIPTNLGFLFFGSSFFGGTTNFQLVGGGILDWFGSLWKPNLSPMFFRLKQFFEDRGIPEIWKISSEMSFLIQKEQETPGVTNKASPLMFFFTYLLFSPWSLGKNNPICPCAYFCILGFLLKGSKPGFTKLVKLSLRYHFQCLAVHHCGLHFLEPDPGMLWRDSLLLSEDPAVPRYHFSGSKISLRDRCVWYIWNLVKLEWPKTGPGHPTCIKIVYRVFDGFWRELPFLLRENWRLVEYFHLAMVKSSPLWSPRSASTRASEEQNLIGTWGMCQYGTTGEHETGDKSIRYVYCILGDSVILLNLYALMIDRLLFKYCNSSRRLAKTIHLREFRIPQIQSIWERDLSKL